MAMVGRMVASPQQALNRENRAPKPLPDWSNRLRTSHTRKTKSVAHQYSLREARPWNRT